ncbi:MAG: hypothetical protein KDI80_14915, partial [Xanthomonadales bacterium]|nr:hypothetical protein [Xanthomonadales bacterium]
MSADQRSRRNVFAGLALDRCSERRLDQAWLETQLVHAGARFLVLDPDGKALVDAGASALRFLAGREREGLLAAAHPSL